jgi:hypothetical protein
MRMNILAQNYSCVFLYMHHWSYIKNRRKNQASTMQKVFDFFIYNSMQKMLVCEERVHVFYPKELFPIRAESKSYLHYIQLNVHKLNTGRQLKGQGKARRK